MKDTRFAKLLLLVNGLVPLTLLLWDLYRKQVGANPLEFVTRTTGMLTLVFLLLSLAVTPMRRITGLNWLIKFRRMLGLFAFFYGSLHLLTYAATGNYFYRQDGQAFGRQVLDTPASDCVCLRRFGRAALLHAGQIRCTATADVRVYS